MGIGAAIAERLAHEKANLILFARSEDKLATVAKDIQSIAGSSIKVFSTAVDVQSYESVQSALKSVVSQIGTIDVLINNAGLALGAPNAFPDLEIDEITQMSGTNLNGFMFTTYAVLNEGRMKERKQGTIINVTSTTGLQVPPFPGEAVYHASKAFQEAFTNVLRVELQETNIKVLALRPGVVATHFHEQRVGYDKKLYDDFMSGMEPLVAEDVAEAAAYMLSTKERISVTAMNVEPTPQRSLQVMDKTWNDRNGVRQ